MTALASAPGAAPPTDVEGRALAATLECIARHGLSKTTIDDIAREAGCSRATLYRYFGGKADLVERVVRAESDRVAAACQEASLEAASLEDAVVAVFLVAGRELEGHTALRFVADNECELLLPHLTFSGGDRFLGNASDALAPCFERFVGTRAPRAAEWVARLGLMLWLSPTAPVSLTDEPALRAYVRELVVPAIAPDLPVPISHQTFPSRG